MPTFTMSKYKNELELQRDAMRYYQDKYEELLSLVNEGISTEDDDKFEDWNKRLNLFLLEANRDEGRNV